jgi:hypothetical protein
MAYQNSGNTVIDDSRNFSFSNVTIQNNGFLEITSSDGFQGTISGYNTGGNSVLPFFLNTIDKFPFASDNNASDVGNLATQSNGGVGHSSTTHGYSSGGRSNPTTSLNTIERFPFAVDTNSVDTGADLLAANNNSASQGQNSSTHGYVAGGYAPGLVNTIQKFEFASSSNATDVGDLSETSVDNFGMSSSVSGYRAGGTASTPPPTLSNTIDKFPFATDTNATDIGDLSGTRRRGAGISSSTNGYAAGGVPITNTIEKFPFSSDTNATDVGDLTRSNANGAGSISSETFGYVVGGFPTINIIDKFLFATDTNATDVGDLTQGRYQPSSQQD